jgi:chromosome segregation ATPase
MEARQRSAKVAVTKKRETFKELSVEEIGKLSEAKRELYEQKARKHRNNAKYYQKAKEGKERLKAIEEGVGEKAGSTEVLTTLDGKDQEIKELKEEKERLVKEMEDMREIRKQKQELEEAMRELLNKNKELKEEKERRDEELKVERERQAGSIIQAQKEQIENIMKELTSELDSRKKIKEIQGMYNLYYGMFAEMGEYMPAILDTVVSELKGLKPEKHKNEEVKKWLETVKIDKTKVIQLGQYGIDKSNKITGNEETNN